jgi:SulP family sulfate permease
MSAYQGSMAKNSNFILSNLSHIPNYFQNPVRLFRTYDRANLQPDLIAGLTVAVILLPQAIAFAIIAELPPQMGLYAAIIGAIIGGLWGSSDQAHTGPTNAISLLVVSVLLTVSQPDAPEFVLAAGLLAVMVGIFQLVLGMARLGVLVNFVSHSVVVGFTAGAGVLIAVKQLKEFFGMEFSSHNLVDTITQVALHLPETHLPTLALGIGTVLIIVILRRINPRLPGPLIGMVAASAAVFVFGLDEAGVAVIGELPTSLPPIAPLPLFDLDLIGRLSTGAIAVGAIGLVETSAIARSISTQTGQRLDSNQEFVGQGLANISVGFLSGYPCAGSFSRSAVNYRADAKTRVSAIFSGIFVLVAMFALAPLAVYLPRTALAGVLIVTAYGMVDKAEIARIWRGARGDALIMVVTLFGTLFLELEFAVLAGILLSMAVYILTTSIPHVFSVVPSPKFKHFVQKEPDHPACPQLGIIKISGDLYFGAVNHVEEALLEQLAENPQQRFLLLRMHGVNNCDFSGIHMLESVRKVYRDRGGDIFFMKIQKRVDDFMRSTGFYDAMGAHHFLEEDEAIPFLFYKMLDPATCIYECDVRVFRECQKLPKRDFSADIPLQTAIPVGSVATISPLQLWDDMRNEHQPVIIDVRDPREFRLGHIPDSQSVPLPKLLAGVKEFPKDLHIVLVCQGGRRSTRAAHLLGQQGFQNVAALQGGILAWEAANLLEAVDL